MPYVTQIERRDAILAALAAQPMTAAELAEYLGVTRSWITRVLGPMLEEKPRPIYVLTFKRSDGSRGPWAAVYALAPEREPCPPDAERPRRMSGTDYQRERRAKLRAGLVE